MNRIAQYCFYLLTFQLLAVATLLAQPKCKIEHYSTEDGLSHDIITCIFKDREGFMWLAPGMGLTVLMDNVLLRINLSRAISHL